MDRFTLPIWHRTAMAVLLLVVGVAGVGAQDGAVITGSVKDQGGLALPGAVVTALNTASGRQFAATTNEAGGYELRGLLPGSYRVSARMRGFSAQGRTVGLNAGQTLTEDFGLSLGSLSEELTITAAKGERPTAEIPQMITIVTARDIEDRRPGGVQEAYERAPNVRTIDTNPYRARPQFRGLSSSRVLIVIDGERLNNSRYDIGASGVTPSAIDVTQVESIEVVGGAASSLYGSDALAGTINIVTKTADRPFDGRQLDLKLNGDFNANSRFIRGNLAATYASRRFAVRGAFSGFDQPSYDAGGDGFTRQEIVRLGNFAVDMGNAVGRVVANGYAVYDFEGGGEVPNGKANGYTSNFDASFFLSEKHMLRVRYLGNRFKDLGLPHSIPPYDPFERLSEFANLDKFSGRYEYRDAARWLPRIALSGYRQELERPQNDRRSNIVAGSSFLGTTLTGNVSRYTFFSDTETLNNIKSTGFDLQVNVVPWRNAQYTTGLGWLKDESRDRFGVTTFSAAGAVVSRTQNLKSTPDTDYKNFGWYNQLEWMPASWVRLAGGFRLDKWQTEAQPSPGFPPGNELNIIRAALPAIQADPRGFNLAGIQGIDQLVAGTGTLTAEDTVTTGNAGVTLLLPGGFNPYFRWANSFREPEITVRYLIRNFGSAVLSVPGLPNTEIRPEKGNNIDAGLKIDRPRTRVQLGYFRNNLEDAVGTIQPAAYCVPANPAQGILPTPFPPCSIGGRHAAQFFQRINVAKVRLYGFEGSAEHSLPVGRRGSLTPYLSIGYVKGTNQTPDQNRITIINRFYNRSDTPIRLEGSAADVPFSTLPKVTGTGALRFTNATGRWWAEYEIRWASQITRADPEEISSANTTQYGMLKSLEGYTKHSLRGGISFGSEAPVKLTLGLENLADSTYFLPYQNGPSPGFSAILGATIGWKKLF